LKNSARRNGHPNKGVSRNSRTFRVADNGVEQRGEKKRLVEKKGGGP